MLASLETGMSVLFLLAFFLDFGVLLCVEAFGLFLVCIAVTTTSFIIFSELALFAGFPWWLSVVLLVTSQVVFFLLVRQWLFDEYFEDNMLAYKDWVFWLILFVYLAMFTISVALRVGYVY